MPITSSFTRSPPQSSIGTGQQFTPRFKIPRSESVFESNKRGGFATTPTTPQESYEKGMQLLQKVIAQWMLTQYCNVQPIILSWSNQATSIQAEEG